MKVFVVILFASLVVGEVVRGPPVRNHRATDAPFKIIGGKKARVGEFPHQLFLEFNKKADGPGIFRCSANILDSFWAITAAFCVNESQDRPDFFTLHAGHLSRMHPFTGAEQEFRVDRIVTHPNYTRTSRLTHASGDLSQASDALLKAEVKILPGQNCETAFKKYRLTFDNITQICAASPGRTACKGDEGGPLAFNNELIGIVSYGLPNGCDVPKVPFAYTKISVVARWVRSVTSSG